MKDNSPDRQDDPIAHNVMQAITRGDVTMKPRRYFVLLNAALVVTGLAAGFVASYLFALLFWWIRLQSAAGPAFGVQRRLNELISSFPWWALIVAVVMIAIVVWLTRRFGVMYRYKVQSIIIVIVAFALVLGALLSFSGIARPDRNGPRHGSQAYLQRIVK